MKDDMVDDGQKSDDGQNSSSQMLCTFCSLEIKPQSKRYKYRDLGPDCQQKDCPGGRLCKITKRLVPSSSFVCVDCYKRNEQLARKSETNIVQFPRRGHKRSEPATDSPTLNGIIVPDIEEEEEEEEESNDGDAPSPIMEQNQLQQEQLQILLACALHRRDQHSMSEENLCTYVEQLLTRFHWTMTDSGIGPMRKRQPRNTHLSSSIHNALKVKSASFSFVSSGSTNGSTLWSLQDDDDDEDELQSQDDSMVDSESKGATLTPVSSTEPLTMRRRKST